MISGDFGDNVNYQYQGTAPNVTLGTLYNGAPLTAQNADALNFNGHYYYLAYAPQNYDQTNFETPQIGNKGLPQNNSVMYLWAPDSGKYGGIISFNYRYIPNNPDYVNLIHNIQIN